MDIYVFFEIKYKRIRLYIHARTLNPTHAPSIDYAPADLKIDSHTCASLMEGAYWLTLN